MPTEKLFTKYNNLYEFEKKDGTKIKKWVLLKEIIESVDKSQKQAPSIAKDLNMPLTIIKLALVYLLEKDRVAIKSFNRLKFYYKPVENQCLLAEMYYPKSIIDKLKVKAKKTYRMDGFKNVSYPCLINHTYGSVNTIYEGN